MPTLLNRIYDVVSAEAHAAVTRLEHPQAMAQHLLRALADELQAAQGALAGALAAECRLRRGGERLAQDGAQWRERAERCLRAGDEPLARQALGRALARQHSAAALEQPLQTARRAVERARTRVERLGEELERVRVRVTVIDAQCAAAQALHGASPARALERALSRGAELERFESQAAALDCEAEAAAELLDQQDRLERDVARLETEAAVEQALSELRGKIAATPPQPAADSSPTPENPR